MDIANYESAFEAGSGRRGVVARLDVAHDGAARAGYEGSVGGGTVIEVLLADGVVAGFRAVVFLTAGDGGKCGEARSLVEVGLLGVEIDDEAGIFRGERGCELAIGEVEAGAAALLVERLDGGAVFRADG